MATKAQKKQVQDEVVIQDEAIESIQPFICNRNNGRIFPYSAQLENTLDNFYLCDIGGNPL